MMALMDGVANAADRPVVSATPNRFQLLPHSCSFTRFGHFFLLAILEFQSRVVQLT